MRTDHRTRCTQGPSELTRRVFAQSAKTVSVRDVPCLTIVMAQISTNRKQNPSGRLGTSRMPTAGAGLQRTDQRLVKPTASIPQVTLRAQNRIHVALGGFPARVQNQGSRAKRAESAADAESGRPVRPVTSRSVARNSNTRDRRRRKEAARAVPVVVMQLCAPQAAADRPRMTHAADRALRISEGSPCGRRLGGLGDASRSGESYGEVVPSR